MVVIIEGVFVVRRIWNDGKKRTNKCALDLVRNWAKQALKHRKCRTRLMGKMKKTVLEFIYGITASRRGEQHSNPVICRFFEMFLEHK